MMGVYLGVTLNFCTPVFFLNGVVFLNGVISE